MQARTIASRRRFLMVGLVGAAGAALSAACGQTAPPTAAPAAAPTQAAPAPAAKPAEPTKPAAAAATAEPAAGATAAPAAATKPAAAPATGATAAPAAAAKPAAAPALQGKLAVVRQAAAIGMPGTVEPVQAAWTRALELYKQAQPGVSIDETAIPAGDFSQMVQFITAQQAAATLPDLVNHWVGPTNREEDENKSPWVQTTPYLDQANPYSGQKWRDDFEPDVLAYQLGTLKNNYALAVDRNAISWVYNKTLFDKNGWKPPTTYSEFMKLLADIKKANITPIAEYASPSAWITNHPIRIALYTMQRPLWTKVAGSPETRSLRTQQLYEAYSCGVFDYKRPEMAKAFELAKYVNKHCPPGHSSLNRQQSFEMFWAQQGAMIWFSTDLIVIADRLKETGQLKFEWDTFPTPPFDAAAVGNDLKPLPVADISERGRQWAIPAKSFRANKDDKAEATAIDFLRFMSEPSVQEEYTGIAKWAPVNPKAKTKDARIDLFRKNKTPWYNQWSWYMDQPKWFQHWQAFVDDKTTWDQYADTMNKENKAEAERLAREQNLTLSCDKYK